MLPLNHKIYSDRHQRRKRKHEVDCYITALSAVPSTSPILVKQAKIQEKYSEKSTLTRTFDDTNIQGSVLDSLPKDAEYFQPEIDDARVISSDEDDLNCKYDANFFRDFLRKWVPDYKVPSNAVSDLLKLLRNFPPFQELPNDCRTLLKTPRTTLVRDVAPGHYCHFGLKKQLLRIISSLTESEKLKLGSQIKLQINVDGLPLLKSSTQQFWPILGYIKGSRLSVFAIGLFCGNTKPDSSVEYLKEFISELKKVTETGLKFQDEHVSICIDSFICDAPARSNLLSTKGHSGYKSCTKCAFVGSYTDNRVILCNTGFTKRTNEEFRNKTDPKHHNGNSPLVDLNFDIVKCFPYEFMHFVCLGVMRKLLNLWTR
ncbi:unnamed protein product [Allacma fusca]|uniref:Uncharacterized protein n=1 Tax=Allacma fusca TaxID=39272 RepID=A0A8J2NZ90_9HEXA|nr:unnamed protein product [Allacma fusca]